MLNKKILSALMAAGLLLCGCGGEKIENAEIVPESTAALSEETAAPTEASQAVTEVVQENVLDGEPPAQQTEKEYIIGKERQGDAVYQMQITNKTGSAISEFSYKGYVDSDFKGNMLGGDYAFEPDEERTLYFDTSGYLPDEVYTLRIVLEDGSDYELHKFAYTDISSAEICLEGGVCYLNYVSKSSGGTVSTYDQEAAG